jgi:hypothetical protein
MQAQLMPDPMQTLVRQMAAFLMQECLTTMAVSIRACQMQAHQMRASSMRARSTLALSSVAFSLKSFATMVMTTTETFEPIVPIQIARGKRAVSPKCVAQESVNERTSTVEDLVRASASDLRCCVSFV